MSEDLSLMINTETKLFMIKKVIRKGNLNSLQSAKEDLAYWLTIPQKNELPVDFLREQFYGNTERLQRVARVIKRR